MSLGSTPPPVPLPAAPVATAKSSYLLLKILGGIVLLFVLKSMFSHSSGSAASDNPLIGSWTLAPAQDVEYCPEKVSFTKKKYFQTVKGVETGGDTVYDIKPTFVVVRTTNAHGMDEFALTSPTSITKQYCSSMSCTYCLYNKD